VVTVRVLAHVKEDRTALAIMESRLLCDQNSAGTGYRRMRKSTTPDNIALRKSEVTVICDVTVRTSPYRPKAVIGLSACRRADMGRQRSVAFDRNRPYPAIGISRIKGCSSIESRRLRLNGDWP